MKLRIINYNMRTILFVALSVFCLNMFGQEGKLVIKKAGSEKGRSIPNGKIIKITTEDGNKFRGSLQTTGDSKILINSDTIALNEIVKIRNKSRAGQISGLMVVGIGGGITTLGLVMITQMTKEGLGAALVGIIIGIPLTGVGIITTTVGLVTLAIGKKYRANKWEYTIVYDIP